MRDFVKMSDDGLTKLENEILNVVSKYVEFKTVTVKLKGENRIVIDITYHDEEE